MVSTGFSPPPKIAALLADPIVCSQIAQAWESLERVGVAIIFDLPLFCKKEDLDPSATVLAANKILTTLQVFRDQAKLDRKNAEILPK